ncbi:MAG: hypothetical protein A3J24_06110 [Deltaproteobacteria bacterium RIFCSPLOWO2_02_FULL_53_8]|nr:MAG: hypothetical protein A3J24_06110 [Deltaproteobacteria bacterium RIFCSPLOWO2_02_FULL_53_8]
MARNAKKTKKPVLVEDKSIFPIVGIGASAGGLEALEGFFAKVPHDVNIAFVVVQHLAHGHKSIMADLLGKYTWMKIVEITDGVKIKPGVVYLNPPGKDVAILKGVLYLTESDISHPVRFPIDSFFVSLAQAQRERAICIVLSGTGSDGTLGLKAVKREGGVTFAQEEKQAKYAGMPGSAISTGMVDYVMPVEEMPGVVVGFSGHPYFLVTERAASAGKEFDNSLQKIFLIVRSKTGHDFSNYKLSTIRRRIERRMAIHLLKDVGVYLKFLKENPDEVDALYKDFLIGVTNFFRDAAAFDLLKEKVVADIVNNKSSDSVVRIWVPGCATGEEAYSIAMLFVEVMEAAGKRLTIQVFATDIDKDAIDNARLAIYPESISTDVSAERLRRFFIKEDGFYRVRKPLREMVVFAEQNITKDPPFSRLDLVSCRNMLIYMETVLQKQILPLFYYTLVEGGYLFLGSSESIGALSDLFSPVSVKWKIFRRKGAAQERRANLPAFPLAGAFALQNAGAAEKPLRTGARDIAERFILNEYGPPSVLVDDKFNVLYFYGKTEKYLVQQSGEPSFNIFKMAKEEIRYSLSMALHKAIERHQAVAERDIRMSEDAAMPLIDIVARPVDKESVAHGMYMVIFEERPSIDRQAVKTKKRKKTGDADPRVASLEHELQSTKEYLQTTIEELEAANEELRSTNEELQSTNEELQSTNEEMETSKEELQSTNEELVTVNAEFHNKMDDLTQTNNDLQNLLASTEIGTVFLDRNLCIKRFTPSARRVFNLIVSDAGRPFGDITSKFDADLSLTAQAAEVLETLIPKNFEVMTRDGAWFAVRILPYRTADDVIDGLVITCSDITRLKQAEQSIDDAREYAESIVNTIKEPLLILDAKFYVKSANRAFYETFNAVPDKTVSQLIYNLGSGQWNLPALRSLLEEIIPKSVVVERFKIEYDFKDAGRRAIFLNARMIRQRLGRPDLILIAFEIYNEGSSE